MLKAVGTNPKVGSIDHPYGKQKGRRQPRELGQLQQFFFFLSTGKLLVFHVGGSSPAEKAAAEKHQFLCVSFEKSQRVKCHHLGLMTELSPQWAVG